MKIPPATRSAEAPKLSPIANPIKQAPARCPGTNKRIVNININSTDTKHTPIDIPALRGIFKIFSGLPLRETNAVLAFAKVFILIPNHATPYEPSIPITDQPRIIATSFNGICCK